MLPLQLMAPRATVATLDYAPAAFSPEVSAVIYGSGTQSAYRAAGEQAIESVALKIFAYKAALIESSTAKNPFLTLLKELSQRRHQHAVEAESPKVDAFGRSRESTFSPFKEQVLLLHWQYQEWSDHLKAFISAKLEAHLEALAASSLPATTQFTLEERVLGQQIQVTFNLAKIAMISALELAADDCNEGGLRERYYRYIDLETAQRFKSSDLSYRALLLRTPFLQAMIETRIKAGELSERVIDDCVNLLRREDQEKLFNDGKLYTEDLAAGRCRGEAPRVEPYPDYEQIKLSLAIKYYRKAFPTMADPVVKETVSADFAANARTHFLIIKLSQAPESTSKDLGEPQIETLTRYLLPLQANPGESIKSTLSKMRAHTTPFMLHQDVYLIEKTLQHCSSLFEKIMLWKVSESPTLLKEQMAGLIWLLAHNHRDVRGTAAATEWLERAIYKAHGFAVRTFATRMIDCAALTTPLLSEFVSAYSDSLTLEPLPLEQTLQ